MLDDDEKQQSVILVVLAPANVERMKQADPVMMHSPAVGGMFKGPKYPRNFMLMIAYEEDQETLKRIVEGGTTATLLQYLGRGYRFNPKVDGKVGWNEKDSRTPGES